MKLCVQVIFKDAYTPWKAVLENCPTLRFYTFTDGYKILKGLMGQIKDRNNPEYQKYFDELMNTHDLRIKYTDEFLAKGTKVSSADEALGIKASRLHRFRSEKLMSIRLING